MKLKKILKWTLIISILCLIFVLSATLIFIKNSIDEVKYININLSTDRYNYCTFYDKDNNEIEYANKLKNNYTELKDINQNTIDAFISIEDKKFYVHNGLNFKRIAGAMLNNIRSRNFAQGASTITQQLVKNKYLTNDKKISRKIKEAYLTIKMENKESKDKILESYLNTIYYGNGAYGIGEASYKYFNKLPSELNLNESCILAGLVKSPSKYSPINNPNNCKIRRNIVLEEMLEDKKISEEKYNKTINEEIITNEQKLIKIDNLDLYEKCALKEASKILNIDENEILNRGYKIYTYKASRINEKLETIIDDPKYYPQNSYGNITDSLSIILDNSHAGVVAIAGKSDYDLTNFKRQPGSLIKPQIAYTPALENNLIYPCSKILDEKTTFGDYTPKNVSDKYYGYVSIRDAVAKSLNIPAVKLVDELGIDYCKEYVKNCGLDIDESDCGLAIALGGLKNGFTLQNIANSYYPYNNDGNYTKSTYIEKILTSNNMPVYNRLLSYNMYCKASTSYLMTDIMSKTISNSTSKKLSNLPYKVAGKTGTVNVKDTNYNTDAYSLAYTTEHIMCTWFGNYTMQKEFNLEGNNNGGTYATELIKDTFEEIYKDNFPKDFEKPNDIIELEIDSYTLESEHKVVLANNIPDKYKTIEIFDINNAPTTQSNRFSNITAPYLAYEIKDNTFLLSFEAVDFYNYQLYKVDEKNNKEIIKSISNKNNIISIKDSTITPNKHYKYYLEIKSNYSNDTKKSNIVDIILNKNYNKILDNNSNSTSWIFS